LGAPADARHPCRAPLCPMGIRADPDKTCDARRGKRGQNTLLRNVRYYDKAAKNCLW
jgi:hypothetical protein